MNDTADIEGRLNDYRQQLAVDLQDLEGNLRQTLSVRRRIASHPAVSVVAALGAGILLGIVVRRALVRPRPPIDDHRSRGAADSRLWRFSRDALTTLALRLALSATKR